MSRGTRIALAAAVAALSLAVAVAPAMAGKTGPNNASAKLCQKGGWQTLYQTTAPYAFASEQECVSYAAQGGSLLVDPPSSAALCVVLGGSFVAGDGNPILWDCNRSTGFTGEEFQRLAPACFTDGGNELANLFPGARCMRR
jgi:hypothetical protein